MESSNTQTLKNKFNILTKNLIKYVVQFMSLNDLLVLNYISKRFKSLFTEPQVKLFRQFTDLIKSKNQEPKTIHKFLQNELIKIREIKNANRFSKDEIYQLTENYFTYKLANKLEDSYRLSFNLLNSLKLYYVNTIFKYLGSSQCQMTLLNLACNSMYSNDYENALSQGLELNKSIRVLDMSYMKFSYENALKNVKDAISANKGIQKFIMVGSEGNNNSIIYLENILKGIGQNNSIKEAYICENKYSTPNIGKAVGGLLHINTKLQILSFAGNNLYDEGVSYICKGLILNNTLKNLYLANNNISGYGLEDLCKVLNVNNTLEHLDLANNPIKKYQLLGKTLAVNKGLKYFNMKNCGLTDLDVKYLCEGLIQNKTLQSLILYENPEITDKSYPVIVEMLNSNKTLKELDLSYTKLSQSNLQEIGKMIL